MAEPGAGVPRRGRGHARSETGAASIAALGIVGAIVALAMAAVPLLGGFVGSQRAENAADAAALAAADAISGAVPGVPCELAAAIAARNGASLASCQATGPVASVTVAVAVLGFRVAAAARAGPPGSSG